MDPEIINILRKIHKDILDIKSFLFGEPKTDPQLEEYEESLYRLLSGDKRPLETYYKRRKNAQR